MANPNTPTGSTSQTPGVQKRLAKQPQGKLESPEARAQRATEEERDRALKLAQRRTAVMIGSATTAAGTFDKFDRALGAPTDPKAPEAEKPRYQPLQANANREQLAAYLDKPANFDYTGPLVVTPNPGANDDRKWRGVITDKSHIDWDAFGQASLENAAAGKLAGVLRKNIRTGEPELVLSNDGRHAIRVEDWLLSSTGGIPGVFHISWTPRTGAEKSPEAATPAVTAPTLLPAELATQTETAALSVVAAATEPENQEIDVTVLPANLRKLVGIPLNVDHINKLGAFLSEFTIELKAMPGKETYVNSRLADYGLPPNGKIQVIFASNGETVMLKMGNHKVLPDSFEIGSLRVFAVNPTR